MNEPWSERELHEAAVLVRQSLLSSLPAPSACRRAFSPAFEQKMDALIRQMERGQKRQRFLQGAYRLLFGAPVSPWTRPLGEELFAARETQWALPEYKSEELLRDYAFDDLRCEEDRRMERYRRKDGLKLLFGIRRPATDDTEEEAVQVGMSQGRFYPAAESGGENELRWIDSTGEFTLSLRAALPREELLRIAESLVPD